MHGLIGVAKSGFEQCSWADVFRLLAGDEFSRSVEVWVRPSEMEPSSHDVLRTVGGREPDAKEAQVRSAAIVVGAGLIMKALQNEYLAGYTGHHDATFLVRLPATYWNRNSGHTVAHGAGLDEYADCPIIFSRAEVQPWLNSGARRAFARGVRPDADDPALERMQQLMALHGWTKHRASQEVAPEADQGTAEGDSVRRRLQDKFGKRFEGK